MSETTNYAPVLIPTLNRIIHFKRCVDSLSRCTEADKTSLYIALDYPLKETHWEGYNQICDYISEIQGFENVIIIRREKNFGAIDNLFDAQKTIFEKYDRMILSEDDNEFSPNFLSFINWGLEKYKDEDNVFSICGYNYPIDMSGYDKDYYFSNDFSAWGCGIWKDKWEYINTNVFNNLYIVKIFKSTKNISYLFKNRVEFLHLLRRSFMKNVILGDVLIASYLHLNNIYNVFPSISKVKNWGFDGSGVNCRTMNNNNLFNTQIVDKNNEIKHDYNLNIENNEYVNLKLKTYFSIPFKYKLKIIILLLLFYLITPKFWISKLK